MKLVPPTLRHYLVTFILPIAGVPLAAIISVLAEKLPLVLVGFLCLYALMAAGFSVAYAAGRPAGGKARDRYGKTQYEMPLARLGPIGRVVHLLIALAWLGYALMLVNAARK